MRRQRRRGALLAVSATAVALGFIGMVADVDAGQPDQGPQPCQLAPGSFELVNGYSIAGERDAEPSTLYGRREGLGSPPPPAATPTATPAPTPQPTPLPICTPTATPTPLPTPAQSPVPGGGSEPEAEATGPTPTATPVPDLGAVTPANVGRLIRFIEAETGRSFPGGAPPITFLQRSQIGSSSVDELVPAEMWDLLQVSGLVAENADRDLAAEAWGETGRGQCCPVVVVDGHDRVSNEIIIVHELTHALDWPMMRHPSNREIVAPERAIVEGNAHRIAYAYANTLGLDDLQPPPAIFPAGADPRMPTALREIFEYPYDEGKDFVEALAARGGEQAVLDAFLRQPLGVEVLHPDLWFDQVNSVVVDTPHHLVLDPATDKGQLGAFFLYLLLEPTARAENAHRLTKGWRGDAYALTTSDSRRCLGIQIITDTAATATEIAGYLATTSDAVVTAAGTTVEFSRCLYSTRTG